MFSENDVSAQANGYEAIIYENRARFHSYLVISEFPMLLVRLRPGKKMLRFEQLRYLKEKCGGAEQKKK